MSNATLTRPGLASPDLTTFCGLDELGLVVTAQEVTPALATLHCQVVADDGWCHECGGQGKARDTALRRLSHIPFGTRPTILAIRVRRYRCIECGHVWRQDTSQAAHRRSHLSKAGLEWALRAVVCQHLPISQVARCLQVAWDTANRAVLEEGHRRLIKDPTRLEGVRVLGVDEHVWRHTRKGDKYVTVMIDLTPLRDGTGPARLIDMVEGRSKAVFKTWLAARPKAWREGIEIVTMDGFSGYKSAASEEVPQAVTVMDPFHVVKLASQALDLCRQRTQQAIFGRRGKSGDPLYQARRTLLTGQDLLTDKQHARLKALFDDPQHAPVYQAWGSYQKLVAAYRCVSRAEGKDKLDALIRELTGNGQAIPKEMKRLGRTLKRRRDDILAYFDHHAASNGPTEAINGRLEHLRGTALGFRNLKHYITRSLLEVGGFQPKLHP